MEVDDEGIEIYVCIFIGICDEALYFSVYADINIVEGTRSSYEECEWETEYIC